MPAVLLLAPLLILPAPVAGEERAQGLRGEELPYYFCVKKFFRMADFCYRHSEESYAHFLRELGIDPDPNSDAARAVTRAMLRANALFLERSNLEPYRGNRALFLEAQDKHFETVVRRLRALYDQLLRELKEAGAPTEPLLRYIDTEGRQGNFVATTWGDPRTNPTIEIARKFEEGLEEGEP